MRVLLSNKFYYRRGGDCVYTLNLERLLKERGHDVAVFSMRHPQNLSSQWEIYFPSYMSAPMALTRPFGSAEVRRKFSRLMRDFRPHVAHLNNIHTHLSPVIAQIAHRQGARVVWTLHDYKLLCPRYDCLLDGKTACQACFGGDKRQCVSHRCIKGSLPASIIGYREAVKWSREATQSCTDTFICPSRFMARMMEQGGFDKGKLRVLCNFIDTNKCRRDSYDKSDYYCFVGRLSHEKGVRTLVEAASRLPYPLKIVGGGPLEDELKALAAPNVEFIGFKHWDEIKVIAGRARFAVVPSEWYENNPLSVIEAQCLGTPILGARIGGIPELIEEGATGMTFESGDTDDLRRKITLMFGHSFDYSEIARRAASRYDAQTYYDKLMAIYGGE